MENTYGSGARLGRRFAAPPSPDVDADPFLATWNNGARTSGKFPLLPADLYLLDNFNESDFSELLNGANANFYGGRVKLQNPTATLRFGLRKYRAKVEKLRVFMRGTYNPISFYYTPKGSFTRQLLGVASSGAGWVELLMPSGAQDVVWVDMVSTASPNANEGIVDFPNSVEIYGSWITPAPVIPTVRRPKFKQELGINAFEWNVLAEPRAQRLELLQQHYNFRHYLDREHLEPAKGQFYFSPSNNRAGTWDYDDMYKTLQDAGHPIRMCIKNVPLWMQASWPAEFQSSESLPLEFQSTLADTIAKAKLPASYLDEGVLLFNAAARYGRTAVDLSRLSIGVTQYDDQGKPIPLNVKTSGLGLVSVIEGRNEGDSWWHGTPGCMTAETSAPNDSTNYDGDMGRLGPNVGVKQADPTMQYHSFGQGNATPQFVLAKIDWCREHRGYLPNGRVNVPWDALNYHMYSNDGGSVQNGGNTTRGMAPELSGWADRIDAYHALSDELLGGMPVVLGEYGFDIAQFSDQRAARPIDIGNEVADKTTRKFVQAQWMLRSALIAWVKGLDTLDVYMLDDVSSDEVGHYAQGGLSNGFYDPTRRPAGYFFYQAKQLLGECQVDAVLSTAPYVVRGVSGSSTTYALWSPTETAATTTYVLNLPQGGTLYTLSLTSTTPTTTSLPAGSNTIPVSETPCFVVASLPPAPSGATFNASSRQVEYPLGPNETADQFEYATATSS